MAKLIQLSNGDWIDASTVTGVRAVEGWIGFGNRTPQEPRVVVFRAGEQRNVTTYPTYEDAVTARDQLAATINEAR